MISYRTAHVGDFWRTTYERDYGVRISSIKFVDQVLWREGELSLKLGKGISAIVGRNGVGKSNLMRFLYNCFWSEESNRKKYTIPDYFSGSAHVSYSLDQASEAELVIESSDLATGDADSIAITGFVFDPCSSIPILKEEVLSQPNFYEILDAFSTEALNEDELEELNYLTNARYDEVEVTVIEDEFDFGIVPFFKVSSHGVSYDSTGMGLGELSVFYFYWLVRHLSKYESHCILIVEEPESFLPPTTQERLTNVVARLACDNGISCIISTHSEHILKRIPISNISILRRDHGNGVCTDDATNGFDPIKVLGLTPPKSGIILHEDYFAGVFIKSILRSSKKYSLDCFYFYKSDSLDSIVQTLGLLKDRLEGMAIVGLLDGDARARYDNEGSANWDKMIFLPSSRAPEKVLIEYIEQQSTRDLASALGVEETALIEAKSAATGADHHDYIHDLSDSLGEDFGVLASRLCDIWSKDLNNIGMIEEILQKLDNIVDIN